MHKRVPLVFPPPTQSASQHLQGTCAEVHELWTTVSETPANLLPAQFEMLLLHCNPHNGLSHQPDCPARDPEVLKHLHDIDNEPADPKPPRPS